MKRRLVVTAILVLPMLIVLSVPVGAVLVRAFDFTRTTPVAARSQYQLVYTKMNPQKGSLFVGDVYLLDINTSEITQLVQSGKAGVGGWLPRGEHLIVYERPKGSVIHHYILDVSNGSLSDFPTEAAALVRDRREQATSLSPDGQYLFTDVVNPGDPADVRTVVMRLDGEQPETLHTLENVEELSMRWLPNSETLFYQKGNQACLLNITSGERGCWHAHYTALSYSVDRVWVAFTTGGQPDALCVAAIDGISLTDERCYDEHHAPILFPAWRP